MKLFVVIQERHRVNAHIITKSIMVLNTLLYISCLLDQVIYSSLCKKLFQLTRVDIV